MVFTAIVISYLYLSEGDDGIAFGTSNLSEGDEAPMMLVNGD